mmetsp:Transcript_20942/g.45414  ORF Transcript_20942/g.45414 Transcript_20942/m.45414 type:complete len:136 (+) Transcript_20942:597-1004(+)
MFQMRHVYVVVLSVSLTNHHHHFSSYPNRRTFHDDRISIEHAAESCIEILGIPSDKAQDLSLFAKHQGFSCLGTWPRDECLSMGEELSSRDLDCRVIPFNEDSVPEGLPEFSVSDEDVDAQKAFVENAFLLSFSG